ncbi:choice-of-anchor I family protein [Serinicoccus profundi]|uniref:choice-of-anchor I family protein n=1 Tax=Serinicoccus profundi TaxID=1078471 RepID=UPI0011469AE8|nr:choice-of-anchor I family protein [Serinicoccus profundi]
MTSTSSRNLRNRVVRSTLVVCLACGLAAAPAMAGVVPEPVRHSAPDAAFTLDPVGTFETGVFDESAAEIVAWYPGGQRALVVNAQGGMVDVLDAADATSPVKVAEISAAGLVAADGSVVPNGTVANSVAVRPDGLAVVALEAPQKSGDGWLLVVDVRSPEPRAVGAYRVGALPDMVTLTPRGDRALVANEGEPTDDYSVDPEGTISVVTLPKQLTERGRSAQHGTAAIIQDAVATADFRAFEGDALPEGVRVFGGRDDAGTGSPEFPVSENLEPEYVTVSKDGRTAWVSLQEANALAVLDVQSATVTDLLPLGTVDRREVAFDPSDRDGGINLGTWPVQGFRLPDAIDSYRVRGTDYVVTANEGDARDYDAYSEEARVKDLGQDGIPPICDGVAEQAGMSVEQLQADENLGRLNITLAQGLDEGAGCYAELFTYGTRGFSIVDGEGALVFDSGSQFEQIIAEAVPDFFNSNHSETNLEGRSDDKGPEPEGVVLGEVDGRTYAFIGLERIGGVMVYDVTEPAQAAFVTYANNRDFSVSVEDAEDVDTALAAAGDLGAEGLAFVPADQSPTGAPLVIVGNEVSGTTTFFEVTDLR